MNFIDRTSLGDTLAQRLQQFHGKDAVVLCLQESSLLTCITIASQIRAWLYPLIYEPVYTDGHARRLLGAFDQEGKFCAAPEEPKSIIAAKDTKAKDDEDFIQEKRKDALKSIKQRVESFGIALDKHQLDGRDVILAADVVTNPLPLLVAQQFLKNVSPRSLTAVVGNVTPDVAQLVRISANTTEILDIMSGVTHDDYHYFEHEDTYTDEQKHTLTQHIAAYWQ